MPTHTCFICAGARQTNNFVKQEMSASGGTSLFSRQYRHPARPFAEQQRELIRLHATRAVMTDQTYEWLF